VLLKDVDNVPIGSSCESVAVSCACKIQLRSAALDYIPRTGNKRCLSSSRNAPTAATYSGLTTRPNGAWDTIISPNPPMDSFSMPMLWNETVAIGSRLTALTRMPKYASSRSRLHVRVLKLYALAFQSDQLGVFPGIQPCVELRSSGRSCRR
jgi:hypothetical protein